MPKNKPRIPREPNPFDPYFVRVFAMLSAMVGIAIPPVYMWMLLGLTSDDFAKITAIYKRWRSGDPSAPGAFELHSNMYKISKTEDTRILCIEVIDDFVELFSPLLIRMEGSPNITSALRKTLNIAEPNPPHTKHTDEITALCYAKVITFQGEKVELQCSEESSSGRAAILKDEGAIEIEVFISVLPSTINDKGEVIPPLAPTGIKDPTLTIYETSTKAAFFLKTLPEGCKTKTLQGFARWRDVHDQERTGPLTPIPSTIIN